MDYLDAGNGDDDEGSTSDGDCDGSAGDDDNDGEDDDEVQDDRAGDADDDLAEETLIDEDTSGLRDYKPPHEWHHHHRNGHQCRSRLYKDHKRSNSNPE